MSRATWAIGGSGWEFAWGAQDDESIAAIRAALYSGVNWIDTAAGYGLGRSEEVDARVLEGISNRAYHPATARLAVRTNRDHSRSADFVGVTSIVTDETFCTSGARLAYSSDSRAELADGSSSQTHHRYAFDGTWTRSSYDYHRGLKDGPQEQSSAGIGKGGMHARPVRHPNMLLLDWDRGSDRLSDYLQGGWDDRKNGYRIDVEYLGTDVCNGLDCHVLRVNSLTGDAEKPRAIGYRLLWLARDRGLVIVRFEWHEPNWSLGFPTSIAEVTELKELQPGVWAPMRTKMDAFERDGTTGYGVGQLVIRHTTEFVVASVALEAPANEDFTGPRIAARSKVNVTDEWVRNVGQFEQATDGPAMIDGAKYAQLLNEFNARQRDQQKRMAALDALVGKPARAFPHIARRHSQPRSWPALSGKVVVLDFWAHWCGPCVPDLKRAAETYGHWQEAKRTDVLIVGVHAAGSETELIETSITTHGLTYPICIDAPPENGDGWGTLFSRFAVRAIPEAFVIGRDGMVVAHGRLEDMLIKAEQLARP